MYTSDVFAVLYACDLQGKAKQAFELDCNAHLLHRATIFEAPVIGSRDPTPAPETEQTDSLDCIILRLSQPPKDIHKGYQFGTDGKRCDVVLGRRGTPGISGVQYTINIDDTHRIRLDDESSKYGTALSYNGNRQRQPGHGSWFLSGFLGFPMPFKEIEIDTSGLAIRIEFPNHDRGDPKYERNVVDYVNCQRNAVPMIAEMSLGSNVTTVAPTPSRPRYVYIRLIKKGAFGSVWEVMDACTGISHAAKVFDMNPFKPLVHRTVSTCRKRKRDIKAQMLDLIYNEINVMLKNPHPNVMEVKDFLTNPEPTLVMPYYPLGDLENYECMQEHLCIESLRQLLMGLKHLHERKIVHRDIKPANLLVKQDPFTIIITDFGLSTIMTDDLLSPVCGTHRYIAPEVRKESYGTPVDIWSAAIVILELMHKLPRVTEYEGEEWYNVVSSWVTENDEHGDKVTSLLGGMLQHNPAERLSAKTCLEKGRNLFNMAREKAPTHNSVDGDLKDAETRTTSQEHTKQSSLTATSVKSPKRRCAGEDKSLRNDSGVDETSTVLTSSSGLGICEKMRSRCSQH